MRRINCCLYPLISCSNHYYCFIILHRVYGGPMIRLVSQQTVVTIGGIVASGVTTIKLTRCKLNETLTIGSIYIHRGTNINDICSIIHSPFYRLSSGLKLIITPIMSNFSNKQFRVGRNSCNTLAIKISRSYSSNVCAMRVFIFIIDGFVVACCN